MTASGVLAASLVRRVGPALLVGAAYFAAAHVSIVLAGLTGDVAAIWPPNGILLAALLLLPAGRWPSAALAATAAMLGVNLLDGDAIAAGLGFAVANLLECLLVAALLRRLGIGAAMLDSVRHVLLYVLATILAAALGATVGAAVVVSTYGGAFWAAWPGWWIADLLGLLVVTPVLTAWSALPRLGRLVLSRGVELALLLAGTAAAAFVAFGGASLSPVLWAVSLFMTMPFQIWAAVRFDRRVAMATSPLVLIGGMVGLATAATAIPVADTMADALLLLQAALAQTSINAMTLVGAMNQRRRAEAEARAAEGRLRDAIDSMSDGFVLFDRDDRLELCNDRNRELLPGLADLFRKGTPHEAIVRAGIERKLFPDATDRTEAWLGERRQRRAFSEPCEVRLADGRWLLLRDRGTRDGGTVTISADITPLKQQEEIRLKEAEERRRRAEAERLAEVLRESEERYRSLVEFSPDPILVTRAGRIAFLNAAAVRAFGSTDRHALAGRLLFDLIHPESRGAAMAAGQAWQAEASSEAFVAARFLRRDGGLFHGEAAWTSVVWDGEAAEMIVIRDVTDRVRAEAERAALEARLRQAQKMQALGTLAGGTAHEFNNMLLPIIGMTELALDTIPADQPAARYLKTVLQSSERAAELVQRILAFSRAEEGELEPLDLGRVVEATAALLASGAPGTIAVETRIDDRGLEVLGDDGRLRQLIVNLANNAMQAMEGRTGTLVIALGEVDLAEPRAFAGAEIPPGRYARLRVSDTGSGMDEATLRRIFEPFFTTREVGQGTGLGLAIVHGIVTAHDGLIEVESELGRGTTVTVYLPLLAEQPATITALAG